MKYAVLGTGMVGHTLASKLALLGHEVRMGAREAENEKANSWDNLCLMGKPSHAQELA